MSSIPATTKPRSKFLALLDDEIPNWLAGPLIPDIANLVSTRTSSYEQPGQKPAKLLSKDKPCKSQGKSKRASTTTALQKSTSDHDIENTPETINSATQNDDVPADAENHTGANTTPATSPPEKADLPLYSYKQYRPAAAVVYTRNEDEANELAHGLKGPLGFDLEWVVTFRRGKAPRENRTALVQLCDARMILLVQVSAMKRFPQKVKELIEDENIIKLGANIRNDGQKLFRDFGILASNLVELGALARQADPSFSQTFKRSIVALAKVVERYTQKTLDKGKVRTSNWEANLTPTQTTYAANDAHCALMVYNALTTLATANKRVIKLEDCAADLAREYKQRTSAPLEHTSSVSTEHDVLSTGQESPGVERSTTSSQPAMPPTSTSTLTSPTPTPSQSVSPQPPRQSVLARPLSYAGEQAPPSSSTPNSQSQPQAQGGPRPQHLRAYHLWYKYDMALSDLCANLRSKDNPLAESTVISYVVRALQAEPSLPYSMERLKAFVQLEAGSWARHRDWILEQDGYKKK